MLTCKWRKPFGIMCSKVKILAVFVHELWDSVNDQDKEIILAVQSHSVREKTNKYIALSNAMLAVSFSSLFFSQRQ